MAEAQTGKPNLAEKEEILNRIREMCAANSGKPPGAKQFSRVTGISKFAWGGKYWSCWSEAVREAGLVPLASIKPTDTEYLLERLCGLTKSLGKFPSVAELLIARRADPSFPHRSVVSKRFGTMAHAAASVVAYAKTKAEYAVVAKLCGVSAETSGSTGSREGWVYLVTDGRRFKIGRTQSLEDRIPELSYQNSARVDLVHKLRTDDPVGIERYWQERFADKRKFGEWFELEPKDVAAFKRRKTFM
jgi:hypothetical protein